VEVDICFSKYRRTSTPLRPCNGFTGEEIRNISQKNRFNAAETKRVLSEAFKILAAMPTAEAFDIISKSISNAAKKLG
jgi:hypothetical protein